MEEMGKPSAKEASNADAERATEKMRSPSPIARAATAKSSAVSEGIKSISSTLSPVSSPSSLSSRGTAGGNSGAPPPPPSPPAAAAALPSVPSSAGVGAAGTTAAPSVSRTAGPVTTEELRELGGDAPRLRITYEDASNTAAVIMSTFVTSMAATGRGAPPAAATNSLCSTLNISTSTTASNAA